jgi:hypothetical protein
MRSTRVLSTIAGIALLTGSSIAQTILTNPGPANNGGSPNWAMFFDLTAVNSVNVISLTTANTGGAGAAFNVEIFTRSGSGLGGPVGSGAGSSSAGWTSLGTVGATQGAVASGVSLPIDIPDIFVAAGTTVGVAMRFTVVGPRYFGTGTPPLETYSDSNLSIVTGDARSAPFTTTGSFFSSRAMVGSITYAPVPEPASMLALAAGMAALVLRRRRRA